MEYIERQLWEYRQIGRRKADSIDPKVLRAGIKEIRKQQRNKGNEKVS